MLMANFVNPPLVAVSFAVRLACALRRKARARARRTCQRLLGIRVLSREMALWLKRDRSSVQLGD